MHEAARIVAVICSLQEQAAQSTAMTKQKGKSMKSAKSTKKPESESAVIYARYSSHNQRDVSIDQQVKAIRSYAERNDLNVAGIYADRAVSGTTDHRPEFQRMMQDAKAHAFSYVIVYSMDRFARDRYDAITYKKILRDYGVRVLSAVENISNDPSGILLESLLEGLSEYYSKELSQKIRRGLRDNAEKCLAAGSIPFGYMKGPDGKYAIHPAEGPVAKEIFERVLHGDSYISIARDLNARGIHTRKNSEWNRSSFKFLTNERYMGVYIYQDVRIEGGMPAIISPEDFYAVQAEVQHRLSPKNLAHRPRRCKAYYSLTGKLYCAKCGSAMVGKSGTGKAGVFYTYYSCKNQMIKKCDMPYVSQPMIERFIAGAIRRLSLDDEAIEILAEQTLQAQKEQNATSANIHLKKELQQKETAISNLLRAIEQGIITPETKDRMNELSADKERLKAQIALNERHESVENFTRDEIIAAFQLIREGDIESAEYQEFLFNTFLDSARVDEDHVTIVLRYQKEEHSTVELPFNLATLPPEECLHKRIKWSLGELMLTPPNQDTLIPVIIKLYRKYIIIKLPRIA